METTKEENVSGCEKDCYCSLMFGQLPAEVIFLPKHTSLELFIHLSREAKERGLKTSLRSPSLQTFTPENP